MDFKPIKYYRIYVRKDIKKLHCEVLPENLEIIQTILKKKGYTIESIEPQELELATPTTAEIAELTAEAL